MKAMSLAMDFNGPASAMNYPEAHLDAIGFKMRVRRKAGEYERFLAEFSKSDGDMEKMRRIVIENRSLVFDDLDFIVLAQMRIADHESEGDRDSALHWRWLVEFIINTICRYDLNGLPI